MCGGKRPPVLGKTSAPLKTTPEAVNITQLPGNMSRTMSTAKCTMCNSALDKVCTCWVTSQYPQVHKMACPQGRNHHIPSKNNRVHPPSLPPLHRLARFHALQAPKRRRHRRKTYLGYDGQISQTKENDWPRRHQPNHNAIVSSHIHPSGSSQRGPQPNRVTITSLPARAAGRGPASGTQRAPTALCSP